MKPVKRIGITDTTLRDAHQSLMATRMRFEDMVGVLEMMDNVGYHSMEVWGGATFDSCLRFLDEDPWERLRFLRKALKKTRLQMLLRGQNLVGYHHYPDDVVEAFIKKAVEGGIDIFRIFDALNDERNMSKAMETAKKEGAHVQAAISYTISPVHSIEYFVKAAKVLEEMGADSLCVKDMAGLITPYNAYELIRKLKENTSLPVQLHSHYTSGMASMAYLKAVEAGVDIVDTATSSLALGTSQPPTDTIVAVLKDTPYDTGLDQSLLADIGQYFKEVRKKYDIPLDVALGVDTQFSNQIPGGMISNLTSQLKEQNSLHLLDQVLAEVPRVRKELGYPPLVTPTSQIVGTQAAVNVMLGERYKIVSSEVKNYLKGYYGRPPGQVDEDLRRKILGNEEPITSRPADLLPPGLEKAAQEIGELAKKEEDVITYALFPQVASDFFKRRQGLIPQVPAGEKEESVSVMEVKKEDYDLSKLTLPDENLVLEDEEENFVYPV
ncbi:MAG TPA: pyruvate/oxaloacetate carboxyltransferase [Firmicutes bacterium]|nr:pyruvate/oxaloacetate carboxyltransferase [Bacillota bacterium]